MKHFKLVSSLIAGAIAGTLFLSGCAPKTFEGKVDRGTDRIAGYLDLTESQKSAFNAVSDTIKERGPVLKKLHMQLSESIKTELPKEQFNEKLISQELEALSQYLNETADEMVEKTSAFHALLTPEQKEQIVEFSNRDRRDHWHSKRYKDRKNRLRIKRDFNLQPRQVEPMKALMSAIAADAVELWAAKSQLKKVIIAQTSAKTFDKKLVKGAVQDLMGQFFHSVKNRLPEFSTLHKTLTEKQKEMLVQWVEKFANRHQRVH